MSNPVYGMSPAATATALSLSKSAVYNLLARGELASIVVGRRRVILTSEVNRWLEQKCAEQVATSN
jgi:excisionase family DNA binding protein